MELKPQYDSRKSFYKKAKVKNVNGKKVLQSYQTDVAEIVNGKPYVHGTYSPTTTRHIKEFLKQQGFKAISSKQIMKDYGRKQNLKGKIKKKKTQFGILTPQGIKKQMNIDIGMISKQSSDPLAYAYGMFQSKTGQKMAKTEKGDKLAPEYIRGFMEAKRRKKK